MRTSLKLRRYRLGEWEKQAQIINALIDSIDESDKEYLESLLGDPLRFCRDVLCFNPTAYQNEVIKLFDKEQFFALRWCRQSGKSLTICALLLYYAITHHGCSIAIVGPSWRQTKLNIRRMGTLLKNVWTDGCFTPRRTAIHFKNGSVIEAYPNNPDTIRGPTLNVVWWDECNFTPNDLELYQAILPTLGATGGKLICTSTPWSRDSVFWRMCNDEDKSDFVRHHVSWEQALGPLGPLDQDTVSKIKKQFGGDPSWWKREMEAEWAEDDDVWLPQSLIVRCIGTDKNCGKELALSDPDVGYRGLFFAGLDLAKHSDHSVLCVVEERDGKILLRFWKMWKLMTNYASIIGFVKTLQDRWDGFEKVRVDQTGIGDYIVEDMVNSGIQNVEGVVFGTRRKQEMASQLKERMMSEQYFFPHFSWEKPHPSDYVTELNRERFQLNKDGTFAFSHPTGTHDDTFWATALAVSAVKRNETLDLETIRLG